MREYVSKKQKQNKTQGGHLLKNNIQGGPLASIGIHVRAHIHTHAKEITKESKWYNRKYLPDAKEVTDREIKE